MPRSLGLLRGFLGRPRRRVWLQPAPAERAPQAAGRSVGETGSGCDKRRRRLASRRRNRRPHRRLPRRTAARVRRRSSRQDRLPLRCRHAGGVRRGVRGGAAAVRHSGPARRAAKPGCSSLGLVLLGFAFVGDAAFGRSGRGAHGLTVLARRAAFAASPRRGRAADGAACGDDRQLAFAGRFLAAPLRRSGLRSPRFRPRPSMSNGSSSS